MGASVFGYGSEDDDTNDGGGSGGMMVAEVTARTDRRAVERRACVRRKVGKEGKDHREENGERRIRTDDPEI